MKLHKNEEDFRNVLYTDYKQNFNNALNTFDKTIMIFTNIDGQSIW